MDGFMAMQPDAVEEAAQRIRTLGGQLTTDWGAANSAIDGLGGGIGTGRLAGAFRSSYEPARDQARANADTFPPRFTGLANATSSSVDLYTGSDTDTAELFGPLGG